MGADVVRAVERPLHVEEGHLATILQEDRQPPASGRLFLGPDVDPTVHVRTPSSLRALVTRL